MSQVNNAKSGALVKARQTGASNTVTPRAVPDLSAEISAARVAALMFQFHFNSRWYPYGIQPRYGILRNGQEHAMEASPMSGPNSVDGFGLDGAIAPDIHAVTLGP